MTHFISRRFAVAAALAGALVPARSVAQAPTKIRFAFAGRELVATLLDNPSARDLVTMLPLDLKIADYSTNEKIAHLPRKLTKEGEGPFANEAPGDVCYYAPWSNLALFHAGYRYSRGLIRLGRLDGGFKHLRVRGEFPLRVELVR